MAKKFDYDEYVKEAKKKFNNKYEYPWESNELVNTTLMTVICPEHGEILIYPKEHLNIGCLKCFYKNFNV